MQKVPELDGVRGVAIVSVMMYHLAPLLQNGLANLPAANTVDGLLALGWMGIEPFFVLSGFLITTVLLEAKPRPSYWKNFYLKRALRIYPAYLVLVLGVFPFVHYLSIIGLLPYIFFLANFALLSGDILLPFAHIWSLAVEEQFYLVWPIFVKRYSTATLFRLALSIAATSATLRIVLACFHVTGYVVYFLTPTHIDGLAIGSTLALSSSLPSVRQFLRTHVRAVALIAGAVWLAGFVWLKFNYFFRDARAPAIAIAPIVVLSALVIMAAVDGTLARPLRLLLRNPVVRWVGRRSYAVYLIHLPLEQFALRLLKHRTFASLRATAKMDIFAIASVIALSLILAELSWRILERPALRLASKLTREREALLVP